MALRLIRIACAVTFVSGIAGMIIASVNGNNEGWVVTIGCVTAIAALVLLSTSAVSRRASIDVFDEVAAERVEDQLQALVASGADEAALRLLVRDALRLGTSRQ